MSGEEPQTTFGLVQQNFGLFQQYAATSFATAQAALATMAAVQIHPLQFAHGFDYTGGIPEIEDPDVPDGIDIAGNLGGSVPGYTVRSVASVAVDPAPSYDGPPPPSLDYGDAPGPLSASRPVRDYQLTEIIIPQFDPSEIAPLGDVGLPEPSFSALPPLPALQDVALPDAFNASPLPPLPAIAIGDFTDAPPIFNENNFPINAQIGFTPTAYQSAILDATLARLLDMQQGGSGLPVDAERAIFARAVDRGEAQTRREIDEAYTDFASRGFSEPNGILAKRVERVRAEAAARRAGINRDLAIQVHTVAIENLRFAVTQAIALIQLLISEQTAHQGLVLQAEQATVQAAIDVLNAKINVFNTAQSAWKTQADVYLTRIQAKRAEIDIFRAQIDAELGRVNEYRARIEAAIAQNQLNRDNVELYVAQLGAIRTEADIYNAEVNAVRARIEAHSAQVAIVEAEARAYTAQVGGISAQIDADKARIDAYTAEVQGYAEEVRAHKTEWEGYAEQIRAEGLKVQNYDTGIRAWAGEVGVWTEKQRVKQTNAQVNASLADVDARQYAARISGVTAQFGVEAERVRALVQEHSSNVSLYSAQGELAMAKQQRVASIQQQELEAARARTAFDLQNAQMNITSALEATRMAIAKIDGIAKVAAQLSASAMAAINTSASMSGSSSTNTSYNYSGEI